MKCPDKTLKLRSLWERQLPQNISPPLNFYKLDYRSASFQFFTLISPLSAHIEELRNLLNALDHSFDIIGISETRLHDEEPFVNINIEGYNFRHTPTTRCGVGGGGGMYIKKEYDFDIRTDLSKSISNLTETIFIELKRKGKKNLIVGGGGSIYRHHWPITKSHCRGGGGVSIDTTGQLQNLIVGSIYRHHCPITKFISGYFKKALDMITKKPNKICALMGDFNVDLIKYETETNTG